MSHRFLTLVQADAGLVVPTFAAIGQAALAANERLRLNSAVSDAPATQFGLRSLLSHTHAAAAVAGLYATSSEVSVAGSGGDTGIIAGQQAQATYNAAGVGSNINGALFYVVHGAAGGGIATARGFYARVDNNHATNAIAQALGIAIAPNIGAGPITNNMGIQVGALSAVNAAIGLQVLEPASGATRRAIDLISTSGNPAGGITFGNDVNLYRSLANVLKTDDALEVVGALTNGGVAVALTNDARLTNARTPTAHAASHAAGGTDPLFVPFVSTLPGSPVDGQEVYFQDAAMATAGVIWHLRYRAAIADAYKWEFLGGGPLQHEVATAQSMGTASTWGNLATDGPLITCPLAGIYTSLIGARFVAGSRNIQMNIGAAVGDTTPTFGSAAMLTPDTGAPYASQMITTGVMRYRLTVAAGNIIKARYFSSLATGGATFDARWLDVTPLRVG